MGKSVVKDKSNGTDLRLVGAAHPTKYQCFGRFFDFYFSAIQDKFFALALRIIKLREYLANQTKEYVLSEQVLKSGTAIGVLVREAEQAESKADFIHKFSIALKEAHETEYWLELLHQSSYINDKSFQSIYSDLTELLKLITSIVQKAKENRAREA